MRIIGGRWRGRKLAVTQAEQLRPTPDRVRVTLFNWLAPIIEGANCLDCFAGTGALGFEAVSRGAASAVLVESNGTVADALRTQAQKLEAGEVEIVRADIRDWLGRCGRRFDIVFVDPPYKSDLGVKTCVQLLNGGHLAPGGVVYLESRTDQALLPEGFTTRKEGRAGQVQYRLLEGLH